jgi:hypothetical protein
MKYFYELLFSMCSCLQNNLYKNICSSELSDSSWFGFRFSSSFILYKELILYKKLRGALHFSKLHMFLWTGFAIVLLGASFEFQFDYLLVF